MIPNKTLSDLHAAIVWSWKAALEGTYPTTDHLGNPITKGHGELRWRRAGQPLCMREPRFRMAFMGFKSDLAYDKITFKFHTYDQRVCCMHCKAVKSGPGPLYTDTGLDAAWRQHPRTTQEYLADHNADLEVLTQIPGWCLALNSLTHIVVYVPPPFCSTLIVNLGPTSSITHNQFKSPPQPKTPV